MIGDIHADVVYEIASMKRGKTTMLWLNVSTGKDEKGVTGWRVLDVLSFSLRKSDYLFFYGDPAIECKKNGNEIENLAGVGLIRNAGVFRPSRLWIANLGTKKFEPLALTGIKCQWYEP